MSARQQPVCDYFNDRAGPVPTTERLAGGAVADVAVIGAGFTGLSAALSLAQASLDVRVLEARHVGWGASGRAWGQVAAAAKFLPAGIEARFPADVAERINRHAATIPDVVMGLIRTYGMECDVVQTGNIIAAHTPAKRAGLAASVADLQRRQAPVDLVEGQACHDLIGSRRYQAALVDRRGLSLNPLAFARGLARAAVQAGVRIHEGAAVTGLRRAGGRWAVATPSGEIEAPAVLLATNAFGHNALFDGVASEVMPVRAYQAISAPLSPDVLRTVLPGRHSLNDTRKLFSGIRVWPDGRLQVGVDGPPFAMDGHAFLRSATRRVRMVFPQITDLQWEHAWGGWVDMTVDEFPRLHRLGPGLWSGYGFSGRGIGVGTMMGRDLAALVLGRPETELMHPVTPLKPLWYHRVHRPLIRSLVGWYRLHDAVADARFGRVPAT